MSKHLPDPRTFVFSVDEARLSSLSSTMRRSTCDRESSQRPLGVSLEGGLIFDWCQITQRTQHGTIPQMGLIAGSIEGVIRYEPEAPGTPEEQPFEAQHFLLNAELGDCLWMGTCGEIESLCHGGRQE
jgi:hypothetical protein